MPRGNELGRINPLSATLALNCKQGEEIARGVPLAPKFPAQAVFSV
jgi:hypothetical protein